jgi:hypothetical protein
MHILLYLNRSVVCCLSILLNAPSLVPEFIINPKIGRKAENFGVGLCSIFEFTVRALFLYYRFAQLGALFTRIRHFFVQLMVHLFSEKQLIPPNNNKFPPMITLPIKKAVHKGTTTSLLIDFFILK